ncbi:MAG: DUF86 domain-containing protein [Gammaproteobacteria bacterium]|nr:DUF86 domain-containing protein [Gammaproteobacteria bacterium]
MKPGPESDRILLDHILECIGHVEDYTRGGKSEFFGSTMVQDAAVRKLQIMAESTQRLSHAIKLSEPGIPWGKIAGFRNTLTHAYFGMDFELVWVAIDKDLQPLKEATLRMIQHIPE